jgi:hypothetical protein
MWLSKPTFKSRGKELGMCNFLCLLLANCYQVLIAEDDGAVGAVGKDGNLLGLLVGDFGWLAV